MPKFLVGVEGRLFGWVEVEAESPGEAEQKIDAHVEALADFVDHKPSHSDVMTWVEGWEALPDGTWVEVEGSI